MSDKMEDMFEKLNIVEQNNAIRKEILDSILPHAAAAINTLNPNAEGLSKTDAKLNVAKTALEIMKSSEEALMKTIKLNLQNKSVESESDVSAAVVDLLNRTSSDMKIPISKPVELVSDEDILNEFKDSGLDDITEDELQ